MLFLIIYLLGTIAGIFCLVDIFNRKDLAFFQKLGLSLLIILLSWIGALYYLFVLRAVMGRRHFIQTKKP